ncbi:BrnA antitoxin family protein [bacterium]|nr:BrnA antitoxin family protein [bacterium]
MRKNYDFIEGKKNPYADRLKKQVTIRLDEGTIAYFKQMAEETGIPYQTLINLYLRDCAQSGRRLDMVWKQGGKSR